MAKIIVVLKAILTRIIFGAHGLLAIWRVTMIKNDPYYWYLTASVLALAFEGIFTLTIKKNQEWKWFCPSVFFYLCSVVPAIWLIEVDKFDRKLHAIQNQANLLDSAANANTVNAVSTSINSSGGANDNLPGLETFGVDLKIPVQLDAEMWATVIEQFLMLILIIGRWMLPKGGLTRDQLSQLLLVYIGTAADIIEFFDSFKDDKISSHRVLCLLILSIWSWSLLQFTFVLTATKARRTRLTTEVKETPKLKIVNGIIKVKEVCCNIDVWAILINIILQDAPFLIFRALLILYYKIISYMNIFFTCKNTLVIILQFYRLYVVQQEKNKELSKMAKATVSKNVANAVERASRIGPQQNGEGRVRLVKNSASGKRSGKGPSSKQTQNKSKHRSQESISSQNTNKSASQSRRDKTGRRRSLSAGNLAQVGEGDTFEERIYEDDTELGMSGSALSGTNDPDSQEEDAEESEVPLDEISIASERPRGPRKNIRMSENPGIYKISGSRSSGSSERGHSRYRQDTGYSSSSRDSGNSGGRRGHQHSHSRHSGRAIQNTSRSRNTAQRRRQFISSKYNCSSIEFGNYDGIHLDQLGLTLEQSDPVLDNERLWQRRAAIGVVFFLFVVIFILCMVAIYGGINPRGIVLRENIRTRKTTRPTTTTPEPPTTTEIMTLPTSTTYSFINTTALVVVSSAPVSPALNGTDLDANIYRNSSSIEESLLDSTNETFYEEDTDYNNLTNRNANKLDNNMGGALSSTTQSTNAQTTLTQSSDESVSFITEGNNAVRNSKTLEEENQDSDRMVETSATYRQVGHHLRRTLDESDKLNLVSQNQFQPPGKHHNLRHKMSRMIKFISKIEESSSGSRVLHKSSSLEFWRLRYVI